ncbi:multiple epidermal growth factor-like domains protein 10 [Saccostrea cucullata]|uniref:multiple epidermal growth factor-like domains protein 10 n=1 Tax=Saccostrea cuccullata TaxID=36930 RepID=UPI002ED0A1B8
MENSLSKGKNSTILPSYQYCQPVCGQTTATDGNKDTCTNTEAIGPSSKSKTTSFSVDLGGTRSIYSISILYKEYTVYLLRQRGRFAGFSLYISDTPKKEDGHLCYKNILPLPPLEFSTTCIGYSRYVIFYNERLDGVTYPEGYETQIYTQLCEVDIKGCSDTGVYGSSCNLPCPKNCNEHKCNIVNGTCLGCIPGWTGDMCTETCVGGFYGPDCISYCSGHCLNNTHCSRETGHCDNGCSPGYIEKFCSKHSLSKDQTSSILPIYHLCNPPCGPTTATDGNKDTCTNTDAIGQNSQSETTSLSVDLNGTRSIYSISIQFKDYNRYIMRQRGRFAGFSLYISDTPKKEDGHLCYKNTLPLPPLEFNTTCIVYGRYVIYYNERLDGVTYPDGYKYQIYTQLCEVEVRGCAKAGVYGSNCNIPCPENCQENKCDILNGTCQGCSPGWTGKMCHLKCPLGFYGLACKDHCEGHCRENLTCHHVTGRCEGGCADGWIGRLCDEPCKGGFYGPDCVHNCSGHCLNDTYCSRETGYCDNGCSPGYTGDFCQNHVLQDSMEIIAMESAVKIVIIKDATVWMEHV